MLDRTRSRAAPSASTRRVLAPAGALFAGLALMMLANGLQGSLVSLRATMEQFGETSIGIIVASYYIGFVAGSWWGPRVVRSVGHIRVFAALASLASASMLAHLLTIHPVTWTLVRAVTGLCVAGLYVVVESWLNDLVTNEHRGQMLGAYMLVTVGGLGGGQLLLGAADPAGVELFVIASVLVSLALVPITLGATRTPELLDPVPMGPRAVLAAAPLGMVGAAGAGVTHGALLGLGTVYAASSGLSVGQTSAFMAAAVFGGATLQLPLSRLSDRRDRRGVVAGAALAAGGVSVVIAGANPAGVSLLVGVGLFGGLSWPLYSLAVAHANDWLARDQMVGASATLVLAAGAGSVAGPLLASTAMRVLGPAGLFVVLAAAHGVVGLYALHRITVRSMSPRQLPAAPVAVVARVWAVAAAVRPVAARGVRRAGRRPPRSRARAPAPYRGYAAHRGLAARSEAPVRR